MKRSVSLLFYLIIIILITACNPAQVNPTVASPTFVNPATATLGSTNTPELVLTPTLTIPPSPTETPIPTSTPSPTATPTPLAISVDNASSLASLRVIGEMLENKRNICPSNISPDLKYNLHLSLPDEFALWDTLTGEKLSNWGANFVKSESHNWWLVNPPHCDRSNIFSKNSQYVLFANNNSIQVYKTEGAVLEKEYLFTESNLYSFVLSDNNQYLAVIVTYQKELNGLLYPFYDVSLYDFETQALLRTITCDGICYQIGISPDGQTLAVSIGYLKKNSVILLDTATLKDGRTLSDDVLPSALLVFSPDGATLAAIDQNTIINTWDVASGEALSTFTHLANDPSGKGQTSITRDVKIAGLIATAAAFSPDGKMLAVGFETGDLIVWNLETTQPLFVYAYPQAADTGGYDHEHAIGSLGFSADGSILAVGSQDNTITLLGVP